MVNILVVNCGSSSLKFSVYAMEGFSQDRELRKDQRLLHGAITGIGGEAQCLLTNHQSEAHLLSWHISDIQSAIAWMSEMLQDPQRSPVTWKDIEAVGHRVVHGGDTFTEAVHIDDNVISQIEALNDLAPLHNPVCLAGIRSLQQLMGKKVPMVAVFDTAFHSTLPEYARTYALPLELATRTGIRRYGFHGIAHASLALGYAQFTGKSSQESRLITLQLGHGCSMAAIDRGKSIETSMGLTPLEGLVMGTRSGNIDPAVVFYLMKHHGMNLAEVEQLLNAQSGLLGISGRSSDMQVLLKAAREDQDKRAQLAIDMFCYRIQQFLGAYMAVLQGVDAIVFGGGIGEHSSQVREKVCSGMKWCGLQLDPTRNEQAVNVRSGDAAKISCDDSTIAVYVVATDEETLIAQETYRSLKQ